MKGVANFEFEASRKFLSYNPDTGHFIWLASKGKAKAGSIAGCLDTEGYVQIQFNKVQIQAHNLAWYFIHSRLPSVLIDHRNLIRHDNRICNLREATAADNQRNKGIQKNNTSGKKGVWHNKKTNRFVAQTYVGGERVHLGVHRTLEAAANAYSIWTKKHFGEFSRSE